MPKLNQSTKILKEEKAEKLKVITDEAFDLWVGTISEKVYDLSQENVDLFFDFFNRTMNGTYKTYENLALAILKTYYPARKEEVLPFVDKEGWRVKKVMPMVCKFVADNFGENIEANNAEKLNEELGKVFARRLQDVFGQFILPEALKAGTLTKPNTALRKKLVNALIEDGYEDIKGIFVGDSSAIENEKAQKWILQAYLEAKKIYLDNHAGLMRGMSDEHFEERLSAVLGFFENCENLMTQDTKNLPEFKAAKEKVDFYFGNSIRQVRADFTMNGLYGEEYDAINKSLNRIASGAGTEQDKQVVGAFIKKISFINDAMSKQDEKGMTHPANYFACTSIHPISMSRFLLKLEKLDLVTKDELKVVHSLRRNMKTKLVSYDENALFNTLHEGSRKRVRDLPYTLRVFKYKTKEFDLTGDEAFGKFVGTVQSQMEKHNLPNWEACAWMVASEHLKGKEPINMSVVKNRETTGGKSLKD